VDSDSPCSTTVWIDTSKAAVVLHKPPRRFAIKMPALKASSVAIYGPKQCPLQIILYSCRFDARNYRSCGIQKNFPGFLVPLLGHVEIMLNAVEFKVSDTSGDERRDATACDKERLK
jgi:hypothetical protein